MMALTDQAGFLRDAPASGNGLGPLVITGAGSASTTAIPVTATRASTATLTNVSGSASSVSLFASNANARARTVFNDSTADLYLKFGTTASTSSFTVKIGAGEYYELPQPLYSGAVDGIWSAANGAARLTEVS